MTYDTVFDSALAQALFRVSLVWQSLMSSLVSFPFFCSSPSASGVAQKKRTSPYFYLARCRFLFIMTRIERKTGGQLHIHVQLR